ncbi:MAG: hypothetical protein QM758_25935 [Armatimonas sp.]
MNRLAPFALLPLLALSCARIPPGSEQSGRLLRVTFKVRGQISSGGVNTNRYFVLINRVDTPADAGPVPIVTRPWGNGFAAPSQVGAQGFVGFVLYDAFQGIGGYGLYSLQVPGTTTLLQPASLGFAAFEGLRIGVPTNYVTPQAGESQLSFQIDLNQLPLPDKPYLQINILATNAIPQGADDTPKYWDALGDGTNSEPGSLNSWITIPVEQSTIRTNTETRLEPDVPDVRDRDLPGLVSQPDIDITDWSIELRNNTSSSS